MSVLKIINVAKALRGIREFHCTPSALLKHITATEKGNVTIIQGEYTSSPREPYMLRKQGDCNACPLCTLGLDIKHTDVLILYQFLRSDGCLLPRRITGLCFNQQRRISYLVSMAHKAGILYPPGSKVNPSKRETYKKYNTYFDESTIDSYWKELYAKRKKL